MSSGRILISVIAAVFVHQPAPNVASVNVEPPLPVTGSGLNVANSSALFIIPLRPGANIVIRQNANMFATAALAAAWPTRMLVAPLSTSAITTFAAVSFWRMYE